MFEDDPKIREFIGVLDQDIRDFYFGCNVLFLTPQEIERRRSPVSNLSFEADYNKEKIKI